MFVRSLETRYVDKLERFVFLELNLIWRFEHILRTNIVYIYRNNSKNTAVKMDMYQYEPSWKFDSYLEQTIENILQKCNVNTRENNELDNAAT